MSPLRGLIILLALVPGADAPGYFIPPLTGLRLMLHLYQPRIVHRTVRIVFLNLMSAEELPIMIST
jgi:hypothetical protein